MRPQNATTSRISGTLGAARFIRSAVRFDSSCMHSRVPKSHGNSYSSGYDVILAATVYSRFIIPQDAVLFCSGRGIPLSLRRFHIPFTRHIILLLTVVSLDSSFHRLSPLSCPPLLVPSEIRVARRRCNVSFFAARERPVDELNPARSARTTLPCSLSFFLQFPLFSRFPFWTGREVPGKIYSDYYFLPEAGIGSLLFIAASDWVRNCLKNAARGCRPLLKVLNGCSGFRVAGINFNPQKWENFRPVIT